MGDLQANRIFEYSKHHLERGATFTYRLISPFTCNMLSDLCVRARNAGSADDFCAYQMGNNDKMRQTFLQYMYYMGLNESDPHDLHKGFSFLQRTFFVQSPDDVERREHLKELTWVLFAGDSESILSLLWIGIISNSKLKDVGRGGIWGKWNEKSDGRIEEASCDTFASSFSSAAKADPARFAQIALQLPVDIDYRYVREILDALAYTFSENDEQTYVDMYTTVILVRRYMYTMPKNIASSFISLLRDRAGEKWPEDIMEFMLSLATNHENPEPGKYNVICNDDKETLLIESLHDNATDCVRGAADYAISQFRWADSNYAVKFKPVIEQSTRDAHPAVRFAALSCIKAYYNLDNIQAIAWFLEVAEQDNRVLGTPGAWDVFV